MESPSGIQFTPLDCKILNDQCAIEIFHPEGVKVVATGVNFVHFIHNEGSNNSVIRTLTVEQFKSERVKYLDKVSPEIRL